MGFEAKMVVLCEGKAKADESGPGGETECVLWSDSHLTINFEHITRLEKVVGERFQHLTHTSFRRAGICVMDCLLERLFVDFDEHPEERLAPEILIHSDSWDRKSPPATKKVGGKVYVDCWPHRLEGRIRDAAQLIPQHNTAIAMDQPAFKEFLCEHHIFMDGPLLWATCTDLTTWLCEAEDTDTEAWKALRKDRVSLAIAYGWRHQLEELGQTGARVLFRFS